jgi:hypothetical protein
LRTSDLFLPFLLLLVCVVSEPLKAQVSGTESEFTRQDTLRGSITPERGWWDLTYYHLSVKVDIADSAISGTNLVQYKVVEPHQILQVDLQEPLEITRVTQEGNELSYRREGSVYFIELQKEQLT